MATIEERIAYEKAEQMDVEILRAFLKGVPSNFIFEELKRREELCATLLKTIEDLKRR